MILGGILCEVPEDVLNVLRNHFKKVKKERRADYKTKDYRQWYIQKPADNNIFSTEDIDFDIWEYEDDIKIVKDFFLQYVKNIYRFRYSTMNQTHMIDYHKPHLYPRIHIPLNGATSTFTITDKNNTEKHEFLLKQGYAYVLNVLYPHTVITDDYRENCFFSFVDFANDEIKSKFFVA